MISHMLYMGVICAAAVFLTCSQQHVVDVFALESLGTWTAATAAAVLCFLI